MDQTEIRLHAFGRACHFVICERSGLGSELLAHCRNELLRLERKFSSGERDSVISLINQFAGTGTSTPLDAESRNLLQYVDALWKTSKHLFDPSTHVLKDCYKADGSLGATPAQLQRMLKLVGWQHLDITPEGANLPRTGMRIDLNDCVIPYVVDSIRKFLVGNEVKHALIGMDYDVATIGRQPDGSNWLVGIRFPRGNRTAITRVKLNDQGLSVRGNFEEAIAIQGETFGRALSPVDGQPIPGLLSVAVIGESCLSACSAASVARMRTEASGMNWLDQLGLPWLAVDRTFQCHGPLAP